MPYPQDEWTSSGHGRGSTASSRVDPYQGLLRSTTIPHPDDRAFALFAPRPSYTEELSTAPRSSAFGSPGDRLSSDARAGEFLESLNPAPRGSWPNSTYPEDTGVVRYRNGSIGSSSMNPPDVPSSSYTCSGSLRSSGWTPGQLSSIPSTFHSPYSPSSSMVNHETMRSPMPSRLSQPDLNMRSHSPECSHPWDPNYQFSPDRLDLPGDKSSSRGTIVVPSTKGDKRRSKTYRGGRDEFEGSIQFLQKPRGAVPEHRDENLPKLPVHLSQEEQDDVLSKVNRRLSQCAFDWVAEYRFPIPLEPNKPAVQTAFDREWTEWNYLVKRLATKRKIPTHAVYNGQIKELTTILDNALEMRHTSKPQARPLKDDRHVLQFISAGIQVGKMLKDATTMDYLDNLYRQTERHIQERKASSPYAG